MVTAKGRHIWVRSIGEAERGTDGAIGRIQGAFQDTTGRKKAEQEQRELAARLTTTLESIQDGFFTLDHAWRFTYVNAAAERMIFRQRADLIGTTLWKAFPETSGSTFEREYRRALAENVTVDFEEYYPPLERWFAVRAYPSGQGLTVYFLDVTAARQVREALRASEERFRFLNKAGDAVRSLSSPEQIMTVMTRMLGEYLRASRCAYADMEKDGQQFTIRHDYTNGCASTVGKYALSAFGSRAAATLNSGQTLIIRDVDAELRPGDGADTFNSIGIKAIVTCPLVKEGRLRALMAVHQTTPRDWTPDEVAIVQEIVERCWAAIEHQTAERHLQLSEQSLRLRDRAIQEVSQGILITDPNQLDNPIVYASAGVERITGYRQDELLGRNSRIFQGKDTDQATIEKMREAIEARHGFTSEILNYRKDGTPFWSAMSINPVRDANGVLSHFVGVQNDITERKNLEQQLRQSQKMEAVGRLAGGVAHDFNNLLTVISSYGELLLTLPGADKTVHDAAKSISDAGERAAALTRQLLGFSRQTVLQPQVLDLNAVVAETGKMLLRLIGEDILFSTVLDPTLSHLKVDPTQLDQVLMNLAINARDAMPKGGKLTIETANVMLSNEYAATHLDARAGPYVMLAITDTGCGMPADILARIFDPFFTTKETGKGTGLGLAMVFGIVQQSGGCINVYSEPNHGTTFKIYFPALTAELDSKSDDAIKADGRGTETILVVEDDESVREVAVLSLELHGFKVLTAIDGNDAMRIVEKHPESIDLVLTDVVMPNLSGPELARRLRIQFPQIKVLFMSGYTDDAVVRHGLLEATVSFIQKPYTLQSLARKVREVLDTLPLESEHAR